MKSMMEKVMNNITDKKGEGDLILSTSKSLKMSAQKGEINEYKVSSSQILGVRVIKDNRVGISYTESFDEDSLKLLVKQAFDNASNSEPNEKEAILKLSGHLNDVSSYPEETVDIALKTQKALELESKVKALEPRTVAVPYNSYSESESESFYLSSSNRSTTFGDKSYSIMSSALLDDKGKKATYYDFSMGHRFADLQWNKVVENSLYHARNLLEEKTLPTGRYSVRFDEDCLKSLFDCFGNFYSAKSAMDKVNPWATKLGEEVMSKDLSIEDHPTYAEAFRKSLFDSEGVEQKPMMMVRDGKLENFYHNSVTANHFKTQTTGHAARGPSSSLNVSGTHLLVKGKNKKAAPTKYLEVIQMDGLYSGANRVAGTFSVAVKGYVWENGVKTMTFGNITLSGNFMDMMKNVDVTGDKLVASSDQSFFTVPLIFSGLSIAGS